MFNEGLLEEGYAQTYPYPLNTKYTSRFEEAQEEARAGALGSGAFPSTNSASSRTMTTV